MINLNKMFKDEFDDDFDDFDFDLKDKSQLPSISANKSEGTLPLLNQYALFRSRGARDSL